MMYDRYEELPVSGGLYEQPYHFMKDLEWARRGRQRYIRRKEINERNKRQDEERYG